MKKNKEFEKNIHNQLYALQDKDYRDFQSRLIPTIDPSLIIGIRIPVLRKFAREYNKTAESKTFITLLPHHYYEENNLHAFLIEMIKDYDTCIEALNRFLPYVDNWATCDSMSPKILKKHLPELLKQIKIWITSRHTYTIRFGIGMLMRYYLDDQFQEDYLDLVSQIRFEDYYVDMMIAWYFATALAKQYEATIPYIEKKILPRNIHNKTIQKAIESHRILEKDKVYLKTLKIKELI